MGRVFTGALPTSLPGCYPIHHHPPPSIAGRKKTASRKKVSKQAHDDGEREGGREGGREGRGGGREGGREGERELKEEQTTERRQSGMNDGDVGHSNDRGTRQRRVKGTQSREIDRRVHRDRDSGRKQDARRDAKR
jgi:ribonuclease E